MPLSDPVRAAFEAIDDSPALHALYAPYRRLCAQAEGETVLDFGCGYGWGTALLACGGAQVTGYDIDRTRIAYAKERFSSDKLRFTDEPGTLEGGFSIICLFHVLESGTDIALLSRELRRLSDARTQLWVAVKDRYRAQAEALGEALGGELRKIGEEPFAKGQSVQLFALSGIGKGGEQ